MVRHSWDASIELDYYANPRRGAVPEWKNEMAERSWLFWLTFDPDPFGYGAMAKALQPPESDRHEAKYTGS